MWVAADADVCCFDQVHHLASMNLVVRRQCPTMTRGDTALVALAHRLHCQVFQRAARGIVGIINQHVNILIISLRKLEAHIDVRARILVKHLKPGQATHDICSHTHGLFHQLASPRVAHNPFLGKSYHLDMNHVAPVFSERQQSLHRSQLPNRVYIRESAKYCRAIENALFNCPACPLKDVLDRIMCLVFPGQFETFGKGVVLIRAHLLLQVALIEMDMPVNVCRHHQVPGCIYFHLGRLIQVFSNGSYSVTGNAKIPCSRPVLEACAPDDHIHAQVPPFVS